MIKRLGHYLSIYLSIYLPKDKPFAIDGLTGHLTTHGQFREQAASVGSALVKRGLGVDDVVCICAQNCIEYAAMMIGCVGVGAAASPVNTANTAKELAVQVLDYVIFNRLHIVHSNVCSFVLSLSLFLFD